MKLVLAILCCLVAQGRGHRRSIECAVIEGEHTPVFTESNVFREIIARGPSTSPAPEIDIDGHASNDAVMEAVTKISLKVDAVNAKLNQLRFQCGRTVQRRPTKAPPTRERPRTLNGRRASSGDCELEDNGICFWLVAYNARNITMLDAWEECGKRPGGRPGGVYTPKQYVQIIRMMRSKIQKPKFYSYIWVGLKIDQRTKRVSNAVGSRTAFEKWYAPMYPISNTRYTQLYLYADLTRSSGFMNFDPERETNGVLCELIL